MGRNEEYISSYIAEYCIDNKYEYEHKNSIFYLSLTNVAHLDSIIFSTFPADEAAHVKRLFGYEQNTSKEALSIKVEDDTLTIITPLSEYAVFEVYFDLMSMYAFAINSTKLACRNSGRVYFSVNEKKLMYRLECILDKDININKDELFNMLNNALLFIEFCKTVLKDVDRRRYQPIEFKQNIDKISYDISECYRYLEYASPKAKQWYDGTDEEKERYLKNRNQKCNYLSEFSKILADTIKNEVVIISAEDALGRPSFESSLKMDDFDLIFDIDMNMDFEHYKQITIKITASLNPYTPRQIHKIATALNILSEHPLLPLFYVNLQDKTLVCEWKNALFWDTLSNSTLLLLWDIVLMVTFRNIEQFLPDVIDRDDYKQRIHSAIILKLFGYALVTEGHSYQIDFSDFEPATIEYCDLSIHAENNITIEIWPEDDGKANLILIYDFLSEGAEKIDAIKMDKINYCTNYINSIYRNTDNTQTLCGALGFSKDYKTFYYKYQTEISDRHFSDENISEIIRCFNNRVRNMLPMYHNMLSESMSIEWIEEKVQEYSQNTDLQRISDNKDKLIALQVLENFAKALSELEHYYVKDATNMKDLKIISGLSINDYELDLLFSINSDTMWYCLKIGMSIPEDILENIISNMPKDAKNFDIDTFALFTVAFHNEDCFNGYFTYDSEKKRIHYNLSAPFISNVLSVSHLKTLLNSALYEMETRFGL